jgi:RNA polymerase sigma-70 factor (ECF subfamily)
MRSDIEQAVALLRGGGGDAVEKAVGLLQQSVFAFGMKVCGQRQDAEDTMQEVLIKALPHLPKFDNSRALATWLYKVARNCCLMSRRKSKYAPQHELSLDELMPSQEELQQLGAGANPESLAIRGEGGRRLREAVRSLPPHYRIVLVLRDMEGFTDGEIGEITGLRAATVRVRLHRARLFVRRQLSKSGQTRGMSKTSTRGTQPGKGSCRKMFAGLSDYLDGELDEFSCKEIETHLDGCGPCKEFLRSLERSIGECRRSPAVVLDPRKAALIRKKLLAAYGRALATGAK